MKFLVALLARVMPSFLRWFARYVQRKRGIPANAHGPAVQDHIVLPIETINPLVLMAANDARARMKDENAEHFQAELNGCMEALRYSKPLLEGMYGLYMSLASQGYQIEEIMLRMSANCVHLGMYLERQITKQ